MNAVVQFLSQARSRSKENSDSLELLHQHGKYGVCIGLLRQELDTLIRLSYLWHEDTSEEEAIRLMQQSVAGTLWSKLTPNGKTIRITDREMVNLASHLGGWELAIYEFGSKLIHLSDFHLYDSIDPVAGLTAEAREMLGGYMAFHHGWRGTDLTFKDLIDNLPKIMKKLTDNVEFYIEELEERYVPAAAP